MVKQVSILGCGWVGRALQIQLSLLGKEVQCLSKDIEANDKSDFYTCDALVIAIPPRNNYLEVLRQTLAKIDIKTQVILLSSISFYDGKSLIISAENLVSKLHKDTVILRLGGLMGYDRIAGRYTAGESITSDSWTNYIHRDDVIGIIENILMQDIRNDIFDIIAPMQSTKKCIFTQNAKAFGFKETKFLNTIQVGKKLFPIKVYETLGYVFLKEDVHTFWK